ncbi:hypothetical protein [Pararhodobacter sp.]|uniref:hypothetical protein n=1 Tax=Pararhodobacter sp. TaxID=2127056 RepID=UPI002AFF1868|nr:hypothetical protein [Pararhodobacter sp.]
MRTHPTTLSRLGKAVKLPFNIFADEEDRVMMRLDEMHKTMPSTLPEKRFFKH